MPGGDRTGPLGQGPMTGRGRGYCGTGNYPGSRPRFGGRGYFRGRGLGFWRYGPRFGDPYPETISREEETDILRRQADDLKDTLTSIEKRLAQLEENPDVKKEK